MTDKSPAKKATQTYPCPQCKSLTRWDNNPWRPFCSERCRQVDYFRWSDGHYAIEEPLEDRPDILEQLAQDDEDFDEMGG